MSNKKFVLLHNKDISCDIWLCFVKHVQNNAVEKILLETKQDPNN